ncbi:MAG: RNA-binding protein [Halobacteriales archaeon]|nr:RNA-binding protein [Halobacteriales archaeon]
MEITSRHHLRSDAVAALEAALAERFGVELDADAYELVELSGADTELVLVDGQPLVAYFAEDEPSLTVKGANATEPSGHLVTVDAGAVSFVSDGADVMRPGIVDATDDVREGDVVLIAEETHGKVLGVGRSRVDADELLGDSGKVIDSLHHVGDDLFGFEP